MCCRRERVNNGLTRTVPMDCSCLTEWDSRTKGNRSYGLSFLQVSAKSRFSCSPVDRYSLWRRDYGGQWLAISTERGPDAGNVEAHTVEFALRGHIERAVIVIAPRQIVRMARRDDDPEMLPFGGDDPHATWPRHVEVALHINLHAVERVLARC